MSTRLRPFFCYFGGKFRAAPHYPTPKHETIVEPFAGAAGYSTRYFDRKIVLVDRDPIIAGLWSYLIKVSPSEIRSLPLVGPEERVDELAICQEAQWLVGFWLNKGTTAPRHRPSAWMRAKRDPGAYWGPTVREAIASQVDKIKHWRIVEGDFESAPDIEATWFIDPPYEKAGEHYRFGSSGIDFPSLGGWCRSRRGQIIACENEGASWLPFRNFRSTQATAGRGRLGRSAEVIWVNE